MRWRWLLTAAAIGALTLALWLLPLREGVEAVLRFAAEQRQIAWLAFILTYLAATVALVPGTLLTLGAGAVFGLAVGVPLVSVASVLGATAAFFIGRTLAREWVLRTIAGRARLRALDRALAERGFWIVLLTRLSPVFPFVLLNYAYGVTAVSARAYVLGSWLGMLPGTILYVYAGSLAADLGQVLAGDLETGSGGRVLLVAGLLATLAATVLAARLARRHLEREIASGEGTAT